MNKYENVIKKPNKFNIFIIQPVHNYSGVTKKRSEFHKNLFECTKKKRMFIWFYVILGNKMFVLSWAGCTKLVDEKCKYVGLV